LKRDRRPITSDQSFFNQRLFTLKQVFGRALNVLGNRVVVSGPGKQRSEDEQVGRALAAAAQVG